MPLVNHGRRNIQLTESGETEAGDAGTRPAEGWPDAATEGGGARAPARQRASVGAPHPFVLSLPSGRMP
jgi:hypothetical protein